MLNKFREKYKLYIYRDVLEADKYIQRLMVEPKGTTYYEVLSMKVTLLNFKSIVMIVFGRFFRIIKEDN